MKNGKYTLFYTIVVLIFNFINSPVLVSAQNWVDSGNNTYQILGNIGIGLTTPITKLHIASSTSNIFLNSATTNTGVHELRYGFYTGNSWPISIAGVATGSFGRGYLEFRLDGTNSDSVSADTSDTVLRLRPTEIEFLQPLKYVQDVMSIGATHNSGVKAFKFTRTENQAAIWSVPYGTHGRGDLRFTTGNVFGVSTAKTHTDATFRVAGSGGLTIGNAYLSSEPTDGIVLITNKVSIGTNSPKTNAILDISTTTAGVYFPRMTNTQRNAISTTTSEGLMIYNTTTHQLNLFNGTEWTAIGTSSTAGIGGGEAELPDSIEVTDYGEIIFNALILGIMSLWFTVWYFRIKR